MVKVCFVLTVANSTDYRVHEKLLSGTVASLRGSGERLAPYSD